jgi:hypothetical protein
MDKHPTALGNLPTLSLILVVAYRGWREDGALHPGGEKHSGIIADITVNLSGTLHQEHCLTCHPTQAMRVFQWNELGATEAEMLKALKEIYGE